ncbi:hypothetical protein VTH06DRAFT_8805 [Thermothelomyces fergusii]
MSTTDLEEKEDKEED